jgi:hypothetical protein
MVPRRCLAVTAALALAGCQAGGSEGPEAQARAAAEAFLEDCARGEIVGALDILTEPVQKEFVTVGSGLEACLAVAGLAPSGEALSPPESMALLNATRVVAVHDIRGEQFATVTIEGPDGTPHELELEQRGAMWRIATPPS